MLGLADRARVIDLFEALMRGYRRRARRAARAIRHRCRSRGGADRSRRVHQFRHPREGRAGGRRRPRADRGRARVDACWLEKLSMRVSRAPGRCCQGIAEVGEAGRLLAAAEMVLVRIAYAADLPTPDEVVRLLEGGGTSPRVPSQSGAGAPAPITSASRFEAPRVETSRGAPRAALAPSSEPVARARAGAGPPPRRRRPFRGADRARRAETRPRRQARARARRGRARGRPTRDRPRASAARTLVNDLARKPQWTNRRWMVVVSAEPGEQYGEIAERGAAG